MNQNQDLYRNNPKNRKFDEKAAQNSRSEREIIAERQGSSEVENLDAKPTSSKTDSSGYFGITASSLIGEIDLYLHGKGVHYRLFEILGAHCITHQGVEGVRFAVWAPNAKGVSVVGDFNQWNGALHSMRLLGNSGIWELFVPGLKPLERYKFELLMPEGGTRMKNDPFGFYFELRPQNSSRIFDVNSYVWNDAEWMKKRAKQPAEKPINVYEVHLGSWRKKEGAEFLNYRELAHQLADYCKELGFTHVELLPVHEHPLDESWGYQVTGFFAPTSRYGTPADFQYFVDHLHQQGIAVFLDWVPSHFPMDDFSLYRFDGTALYEHQDPRQGVHPHWFSAIFNYGRHEVANFLLASALFWVEKMHVDGLRVDAVASMLYLDYGRKAGEWIPNVYGGKENLEAIEFLKHLNSIVHQNHKGVMMIAEESSAFTGVTHADGLGFDFKWNMGWMNDSLHYFAKDPIYRRYHQNQLTFSLLYAFSERFFSILSHDEVVHMKQSLLAKMPGPDWQKFANLRLLYSYLICHPGKKLLFMGGEFAQWNEWDCKGSLEWDLLNYPLHRGMQKMVKDLNHFYLERQELWERDFDWNGFEWIDFSDVEHCVISYLRKSSKKVLAVVHNFTPEVTSDYLINLNRVKGAREIFSSDAAEYGGSGQINWVARCVRGGLVITLAPLATMIFEVEFE